MKINKDNRKLTKDTLMFVGTILVSSAIIIIPGLAVIVKEINRYQKYNNNKVRQALKRLQHQKMVNISENDKGETIIEMTRKGRQKFLEYKLDDLSIKKPMEWDRKWRVVIFDIPEKKRIGRNALRNKLNQLGFYRLQNSVFVYPYDCKDEIDFIKEIYEIHPFVNLIEATSIDYEEKIKTYFGIN